MSRTTVRVGMTGHHRAIPAASVCRSLIDPYPPATPQLLRPRRRGPRSLLRRSRCDPLPHRSLLGCPCGGVPVSVPPPHGSPPQPPPPGWPGPYPAAQPAQPPWPPPQPFPPPPPRKGNAWKWVLGVVALLAVIAVTVTVTVWVTGRGSGEDLPTA